MDSDEIENFFQESAHLYEGEEGRKQMQIMMMQQLADHDQTKAMYTSEVKSLVSSKGGRKLIADTYAAIQERGQEGMESDDPVKLMEARFAYFGFISLFMAMNEQLRDSLENE